MAEAKQRMLKHRPNAIISLNGGPFRVAWRVLRHMDWPYTEGGESGYNPIVLRGCGLPHPQSGIGAGPAAYDDWSSEKVMLQTSTVLAHGNRTFLFYMSGRDPDGTFAQHKLDFLKRINDQIQPKQPYVEGAEPLRAVGVYHSEPTLLEAASRDDEGSAGRRITSIIDRLRAISMPCEFVPSWRCTDDVLGQFRMLIVSQQTCLSDEEIAAFERYVRNGGHLLVCGECGTRDENAVPRRAFPLHDLLGVSYEGLCEKYETNGVTGYVQWVEHPFFAHLRRAKYNLWLNWPTVRCDQAELVARVIEPNAVETADNYIGWFPQPPGAVSDYAALTERQVGKGRAIYCVSPLTWFVPNPAPKYDVDVQWPTGMLRGIIEHMKVDPGIRTTGGAAVEATFHRRGDDLIVHLLNRTIATLGAGSAPIHDVNIQVDSDLARIRAARLVYPNEQVLTVELAGKGVAVAVPPVQMHSIVVMSRQGS